MSNKTEIKKEVSILSTQDKAFIDIEMVDVMAQAHKTGLKRDELVFQVATSTTKLLGKNDSMDRWNAIFADFENRLVNTKGILPSTARNYSKEVVAILKLANPPVLKPKSNKRTAKIEQDKKDALTKKYEHESLENLTARLTSLIGQTDANAVKEFKEVSSVVIKKTNDIKKLEKQSETQAQKDFKSEYQTWFNDLLKNDPELLVAFKTNQVAIRKQYIKE
jgi:hypothetical protein